MPFDSTDFPRVWMTYDDRPGHDHDADFAAFEANLKRGEPFLILTDSAPREDHEHSPQDEKRTALWMKRHKAELRSLVLAMIMIEPSAAKRLALKPFATTFAAFWGYPLRLAASRADADRIADAILAARTAAVPVR